jgi:uncharacterized membrane protein
MNRHPPKINVVDSQCRSLFKAVSWRVAGTVDTIIISFLVTGRVKLALSIGFIELFTKVCLYYLHERVWNSIRLGKKNIEDYDI